MGMTEVKKKRQLVIALCVGPLLVWQTVLFNRLGTLGLPRVAVGVPGQSQPSRSFCKGKGEPGAEGLETTGGRRKNHTASG